MDTYVCRKNIQYYRYAAFGIADLELEHDILLALQSVSHSNLLCDCPRRQRRDGSGTGWKHLEFQVLGHSSLLDRRDSPLHISAAKNILSQ